MQITHKNVQQDPASRLKLIYSAWLTNVDVGQENARRNGQLSEPIT